MRSVILGSACLSLALAVAQEAPSSTPTVDQIMEKAITASGGREALKKVTSFVATGSLEVVAMGVTAPTELYAKAPNKRLTVTTVEGYGEIKNGYDGTVGWNSEPQNGLVELKGEELATRKRDSTFNSELMWKELYPKSEVTGKGKVGDRDCWIVKLTPAEGKPVVRYYDAENGLMLKGISTVDSPQGSGEVTVELSDFSAVGEGAKVPHTMKLNVPGIGDLVIRYKDYKANVDIEDAKFAKPKQ